tara:strand:+ start:7158 stop:7646 length:489 start_codon:yes stop_codon:yes gene_type:complete
MQIKEKFLEKFEFNRIKECIEDDDFNWFYRNSIVEENDPPYFTHCFFNDNETKSPHLPVLEPLLRKLNVASLIQIRANLNLKEDKPTNIGWHIDYPYTHAKTAIYYLTTCNGPTILDKDKYIEVEAKENRCLIFDTMTFHRTILQTDIKRRMVININYFEKV